MLLSISKFGSTMPAYFEKKKTQLVKVELYIEEQ